ncbi:type II secretion system GspH family protein [Shewanella eurypsychrophilus]|uniref:Type II secretion system GspH family protein n=1 Tax=Shewanella eurypsychrophilus TaxID=2593656 RepID=A0ABX6VBP0_9GAMM|nr:MULTISPECIES: type II secretion system protein [Shewanella]QFU24646.1 prepilin-type N-terminal cleavage/methylation domain-containing protein [Shewanella sp. YLB-09]QPG59840.1 type II secretion system GspH family protein [Shewanella eurypsychrophilus]
MQKQNGFTLIELVVVIIILGILAVTAAPRFINLQSDARLSTLQGLRGAIQGGNSLVYSKAAIAGDERADTAAVTIATGVNVNVAYGYLLATQVDLAAALDIDFVNEWVVDAVTARSVGNPATPSNATPGTITLRQADAPTTCTVIYTEAINGSDTPNFSDLPDVDDC